jgi:hypothetical protein
MAISPERSIPLPLYIIVQYLPWRAIVEFNVAGAADDFRVDQE